MIPVNTVIEMFLLAMFEQCRYEEVLSIIKDLYDLV
jgi:hypothetical protein